MLKWIEIENTNLKLKIETLAADGWAKFHLQINDVWNKYKSLVGVLFQWKLNLFKIDVCCINSKVFENQFPLEVNETSINKHNELERKSFGK